MSVEEWNRICDLKTQIMNSLKGKDYAEALRIANICLPLARRFDAKDQRDHLCTKETLSLKGTTLYNLGCYAEADTAFAEEYRYMKRPNILWSLVLEKLEKFEESLEMCNQRLWDNTGRGTLGHLLKGRLFYKMGKYQEALKSLQESNFGAGYKIGEKISSEVFFTKIEYVIGSSDGSTHESNYYKALTFYQLERYDEALQKFEEVIRLEPNEPLYYIKKAQTLSKLKRYNEAVNSCDQAISLKPKDAQMHLFKGDALKSQGKIQEAMESYTTATKLKPDYAEAFLSKGQLLEKQEKYDDALLYYDEAITLNPNYEDAHNTKGNLLYKSKDYHQALKCFDQVIKLNPNHLTAWHNKGLIFQALDKYTGAIECFNKALSLDPNYAICYCDKGRVLNDLGQFRDALQCFDKAYTIIKLEKVSSNVTSQQLNEINETLARDREALLDMLGEVAKITIVKPQNASIPSDIQVKIKSLNKVKQNLLKEAADFVDPSKPSLKRSNTDSLRNEVEKLKQELFAIKKQVQSQQVQIDNQQNVLEKARIYDKAEIRQELQDLANISPKLSNYCKAFYWTLMNYFGAYRALSTGLIEGKIEPTMQHQLFEMGIKKVLEVGTEFAKGIPFVGGLIGALDRIIDTISGYVKQNNFYNKVNSINKIIMFGRDESMLMEEDISITAARLAVELTKIKKGDILYPDMTTSGTTWLKTRIQEIKDIFFQSVQLYETQEAQLALEDVVAILGYMCKNTTAILETTEPLEQQFKCVVINGELQTLLKGPFNPVGMVNVTTKEGSACCSLF